MTLQKRKKPSKRAPRATSIPPASDFYVPSLPLQPPSTFQTLIQYAGSLPSHPDSSSPSDAHLWFWLVKAKHVADRQRLVVFLNGGPGCSSLDGGFIEVGPLRVREDAAGNLEMYEAEHSWNEYADVMFLDQPAGTGYSYVNFGDDVRELDQAAEQVLTFLSNFYSVFPEYKTVETYLAGESYAGQYIPYIASAIRRSATVPTPLKGMLIGNAWIDPAVQYQAWMDFAYKKKWFEKGSSQAKSPEEIWARCQKQLQALEEAGLVHVLVSECEAVLGAILEAVSKTVDGKKTRPVSYNVTQYQPSGAEWPTQIVPLTKYLDRPDVMEAFHAKAKLGKWTQCNSTVGNEMQSPLSVPASTLLPSLVPTVPLLLYAGAQDLICNAQGINASLSIMEWDGIVGWNGTQEEEWVVNGQVVGAWSRRGNSHMVPVDEPAASQDMLLRFLSISPSAAAGPAAQVPSRIGPQLSSPLASLRPNGSVLDPTPGVSLSPSSSSEQKPENPAGGSAWDTNEEVMKAHEARFGPRRTIVLVLIMVVVGGGLVAILRWRARSRRRPKGLPGQAGSTTGGPVRVKKHRSKRRSERRGRYVEVPEDADGEEPRGYGGALQEDDDLASWEAHPDLAGDIALSPSNEVDQIRDGGAGALPVGGSLLFDMVDDKEDERGTGRTKRC